MSKIQQNTPEWLELRKNKIGASDAPVIMAVSPWKTPFKLWEEKLGISSGNSTNMAMTRGNELEVIARKRFSEITYIDVFPEVRFHNELDWMMASLDGIDSSGTILVEIKCPGIVDHTKALHGQIPEKYVPQLQHQLAVCNLEYMYYFSFDGKDGVNIKVHRDDQYIKKLIQKEKEFWHCMQDFTPPPMQEQDYPERTDTEWCETVKEWLLAQRFLKEFESREKEMRDKLISLSGKQNCKGAGVSLTKVIRKGMIDYTSIPELMTVDVEKYRKKVVESWRITTN